MRDRLLLTCAALAAFGASLGSSFHFDDYSIFADPVVTSASGWWEVWRPAGTRPLTYLTFWLNFQLGGRGAAGYHAVNLALHVAAVLLLYGVLRRMMDRPAALAAAAIFAVHPIQAEAVNYVWARSAVLMTVFCLLALGAWVRGRCWWAVAWFGAALLAKEECAAFPLLLLLLPGKRAWRPIGAMLVLSLAAGAHVLYAVAHVPGAGAGSQAGMPAAQYLLGSGPAIWRYARLVVLPWGFTVDPDVAAPPVWLGLAAWVGIGGLAWLARRNAWAIGALILLMPSSSIFPAADLAADRRMYLPMIALAAALGLGAARIPTKARMAVLAGLAVLSFLRTEAWMTERSLWADAAAKAPGKVRPKIQLARASEPGEAIKILAEAKKIAPNDPAVASETGKTFLVLGRPQDALPEFGRALALTPRDAEAFNNRGVALQALGQAYPARRDFEHALRLDPCLFDPRYNLLALGVALPSASGCRYTPEQERALSGGR